MLLCSPERLWPILADASLAVRPLSSPSSSNSLCRAPLSQGCESVPALVLSQRANLRRTGGGGVCGAVHSWSSLDAPAYLLYPTEGETVLHVQHTEPNALARAPSADDARGREGGGGG
eukprot:335791-Pleurochrysis_carterae.AAC.2